ncbi:XkdF-like putative serine protease domain-containing protein [Natrononativus amylolyticus]|uniref:XkdF-like putative serine protease domain-containing protein n=1 Tax=Natrononativus amylolyticus TaxID=2963434 RepID=UPI0020CE04AE|nr:XkdF-like putative serine protease domain-containing protein [Natrononativus amylolyticus]
MSTTDNQRSFEKTVSIKATDSEEQIATGVVMVPNEVDHQQDFSRGWAIHALEAGYSRRYEDGDVYDGTMHVKFPTDDAETIQSYLLDEPTTIGDQEYPADTWVIERKYYDDELWELIEDGVLAGYSIGGRIPEGGLRAYSPDTLPDDVRVPDEVTLNGPVTEIQAGYINEISDVDMPAVPRAQVQMLKSDLEKNAETLTDPEQATEILLERGHSQEDAERLGSYLAKAAVKQERGEDGLPGGSMSTCIDRLQEEGHDEDEAAHICQSLKSDDHTMTEETNQEHTDTGTDVNVDLEKELDDEDVSFLKRLKAFFSSNDTEKVGQTLNEQNRRYLMAAHDSIESALNSGPDEFQMNRFSDNPRYDFDLGEFGADTKSLEDPEQAGEFAKALIEGDVRKMSTTKMTNSNETDTKTDDLEALKGLAEQNADRLTSLETKLDDALDSDDDAEKSADDDGADDVGENGEADNNDTDTDDENAEKGENEVTFGDVVDAIESIGKQVEQNSTDLANLAKASGRSHQIRGDATKAGNGEDDEIDEDEQKRAFMGF